MATSAEVLRFLIPEGGYVAIGNSYEGIEFIEAAPITKEEFEAGFDQYDSWKNEQETQKTAAKQAILDRLGLTAEEAALLLS